MRWQNLKHHTDRYWLHGQAWWKHVHIEWVVWRAEHKGFEIEWPGYDDEAVEISFGLLGLFAVFTGWGKTKRYRESRLVSVTFHDKAVWWNLGAHEDGRAPRWQRGCFHPLDSLFGRLRPVTLEKRTIDGLCVPMPEGQYACSVTIERRKWKRNRLPWASAKGTYADVKIPAGVPVPGKGENSWDIGEDAIFSLWSKARTVEEAIGNVVVDALETRRKYGGLNWALAPQEDT